MDDLNNTVVTTTIQSSIGHQEPDPTQDTPSMFPVEVYERIIDFLAYETLSEQLSLGPHDLTSCCLTSRLWFPRSRFHLYFEIRLEFQETARAFVRCLEINPRNSDYVRRLFISRSSDKEWVSTIPLVLAPKLKNLSTLIFQDLYLIFPDPRFIEHLSTFSTDLELQLVNGTFRGLSLIQMLSAFPRLRKLVLLISLSFPDDTAALVRALWQKPLPLRHLTLDEDTAPILLPALVVSTTPLATLNFKLFSSSAEGIEQNLQPVGLFLSSCHTLRTLRLALRSRGVYGRAVCPHLSFSSLTKLHHLLIDIAIKEVEDISAVARLLSSISAHALQFLQVDLDVSLNPEILDASAPWKVLNKALLRPSICSVGGIAIPMKVKCETYVSEEVMFRLLPALKSVNVVNRWSHEHYEAFWNGL